MMHWQQHGTGKISMKRRGLIGAGLAAPAFAQVPWRPGASVRIIVPAAAGGTTDIIGRIVAQHLQTMWGTPVVVENRPGAGGTIGSAEMARDSAGRVDLAVVAMSAARPSPTRCSATCPTGSRARCR